MNPPLKPPAKGVVPPFVPLYKPGFSCHLLPSSLLVLSHAPEQVPMLLHLHSGYSEADSVLGTQETRPVKVEYIALPELSPDEPWCGLLEVIPSMFLFAVVSEYGTLVFFKLLVNVLLDSAFTVEMENTVELLIPPVTTARSVCLEGVRYFLMYSEKDNSRVRCFACEDGVVTPIKTAKKQQVLQLLQSDYNTENNVIEVKKQVCYYDGVPIGGVEKPFTMMAAHGTQCDRFQLLVWNGFTMEWWRWTGKECEAVILPEIVKKNIKGHLIWL